MPGVLVTETASRAALTDDYRMRGIRRCSATIRQLGVDVSDSDFLLAPYLPDAILDAAFGSSGVVQSDFGGSEVFSGVVVKPHGKIVGGGRFGNDLALVQSAARLK